MYTHVRCDWPVSEVEPAEGEEVDKLMNIEAVLPFSKRIFLLMVI